MRSTPALASPSIAAFRVRRRPRPAALLARLRAPRLDRQLAAGAASWSSPAHAARALQLTGTRHRRGLARSLERLVELATEPHAPLRGSVIQPCRKQVQEALSLILEIAAKLRSAEPVDARGVARLHNILCDGAGPCYIRTRPYALTRALEAAAELLTIQS